MDSEGKIWTKGTVAAGEEQTSLLGKGAYTSQKENVLCRLVARWS